jgi:hypothetical protein
MDYRQHSLQGFCLVVIFSCTDQYGSSPVALSDVQLILIIIFVLGSSLSCAHCRKTAMFSFFQRYGVLDACLALFSSLYELKQCSTYPSLI